MPGENSALALPLYRRADAVLMALTATTCMQIAMAESDSTTLQTPIPTSLNVTALAKRFGSQRRRKWRHAGCAASALGASVLLSRQT